METVSNNIVIKSPAKINIGLQILDQRPDGFHNISTIFQELAFHDNISLSAINAGCDITANVSWVPTDETNLCVKAYRSLQQQFPDLPSVRIALEKNIPMGAGLGGGSSNAATLLKGLNEIFNLELTGADLVDIGKTIGADVPFFIHGGTQAGGGIGDILMSLKPFSAGYILLVIPDLHIDTAWAYGRVKKDLNPRRKRINFRDNFRGRKSSWELFENDFERIVIPAYPEIGVIKQRLLETGAYYASLSGSGSTVFGIFDDDTTALAAESMFKKSFQTILTHPPN